MKEFEDELERYERGEGGYVGGLARWLDELREMAERGEGGQSNDVSREVKTIRVRRITEA